MVFYVIILCPSDRCSELSMLLFMALDSPLHSVLQLSYQMLTSQHRVPHGKAYDQWKPCNDRGWHMTLGRQIDDRYMTLGRHRDGRHMTLVRHSDGLMAMDATVMAMDATVMAMDGVQMA